MSSSPYLDLPEAHPDRLQGKPIGGRWRIRNGTLEGQRFGGAWHPLRSAERGPGDVIVSNGMILVQER